MVSAQLICEVENFLSKHFSFVKFEIYNYFNNNRIYYTQGKPQIFNGIKYTDRQAFEIMDTVKSNSWIVFDEKSSVKYIAGEFRLFNHIYSSNRYKLTDIKTAVKNYIGSEKLVQIIRFNPLIKDLIIEGRHRVKGIYPEASKYRQNISAEIGDKVYFCDSHSNIASPAYVIGSFANDKFQIVYFTNLNHDYLETQKLDINGWATVGVYNNEIGLTPEQAIKNKMQ